MWSTRLRSGLRIQGRERCQQPDFRRNRSATAEGVVRKVSVVREEGGPEGPLITLSRRRRVNGVVVMSEAATVNRAGMWTEWHAQQQQLDGIRSRKHNARLNSECASLRRTSSARSAGAMRTDALVLSAAALEMG